MLWNLQDSQSQHSVVPCTGTVQTKKQHRSGQVRSHHLYLVIKSCVCLKQLIELRLFLQDSNPMDIKMKTVTNSALSMSTLIPSQRVVIRYIYQLCSKEMKSFKHNIGQGCHLYLGVLVLELMKYVKSHILFSECSYDW